MHKYRSLTSYLPGISIIRNRVINPLLVATEKVVEQYIPVAVESISQAPTGKPAASAANLPTDPAASAAKPNSLFRLPLQL